MDLPAESGWPDDGVDVLAEGAALVELPKLFPRRDEDTKQFQQTQQAKNPEHAQVERDEGREEEGQDREQVDHREGRHRIGKARKALADEVFLVGRQQKSDDIFQSEDIDRNRFDRMEQFRIGIVDLRDCFQQHQADVQQDQAGDEALDQPLKIPFDVRVQQKRIDSPADARAHRIRRRVDFRGRGGRVQNLISWTLTASPQRLQTCTRRGVSVAMESSLSLAA